MSDEQDLAGRTALITGASSGIGRAAAEELARHGAEVIVHGRDASRAGEVVDAIAADGGKARSVIADLTDEQQLDGLLREVGTVDILINNAGIAWFGPSDQLDFDTYDRLFAANVRSAYFVGSRIGAAMAARGGGCIINIGSMAGQIGMAGGAAYSATKASLASFTRSWAAEFSPSGVRVNTVSPGPVYTAAQSAEQTQAIGETTLLNRAARPDDIASLIAFLASPSAAYLTGALYPADGGRTAI